ncbi:MAG: N-methyl-L-tryptophan oxidase [Planctomycetota bacterium]|nr:N-methyl-L-tryptophan oxidase [Planctomycetota bacterium]MEC8819087.1 N-methyl-L-tryptophan oxidase [Planctomycetota bacterium]MEC9158423.1 N-methyl-L-tryptophan oxidase [Planctomycetota bacterium]MEC9233003.1 N-methyl-L-tryptophan oxidase [Planctomycetota bacterium]MED5507584.1 N-methyl-L-tryptophan oxidase [Planctomycetota bacterium]
MRAVDYEVAVLGLGGVGAAAFHALGTRGISVLGIDQFEPVHDRGSSHGQSRIFRIAYFEHPDYVPMGVYSRSRWTELDRRSDKRVFIPTGGAWIGPRDGRHVGESLHSARQHGLAHELLEPGEAMRRWPALRIPEDHVCFHETAAGIVCPEHAIEVLLGEGVASGGRLLTGERIERVEPEEDCILVRTERSSHRVGSVVMALGPWMKRFLPDLDVELEPQRQLLGWTRPGRPDLVEEGRLPVWLFADHDESIQYGFPRCPGLPGPEGVKVARHCRAERCDPDTMRREVDDADERMVLDGLASRVPAAFGPVTSLKTCLYTMSEDGHFIIDRHPQDHRVVLAAGFSGHGFKFLPALGTALAELALDGGTSMPVGFLGLDRLLHRQG